MKNLLIVDEPGSVPALYAVATFPENVPRIWCVNWINEAEPAGWFEAQDAMPYRSKPICSGLAAMAREEVDWMNDPAANQNDVATARRAIMMNVRGPMHRNIAPQEVQQDRTAFLRKTLARASAAPY